MRRWVSMVMLTALWAGTPMMGEIRAETIRFAPLPMENRETVVKQFRPMTAFLEERLGVRIEYVYSENYGEILDNFKKSAIDLTFLGPLPYVELRAVCPSAEPLVSFKEKSGQATYTCALVAFPDDDFDLSRARYRTIALTQPLSTCGYLSTAGLLRRHGVSLEDTFYRYLDKHDLVALSVIRGEFDAGGLKTAIARRYTHMGLQILAETPPLPGFVLVGNAGTLGAELRARIIRELIALDPAGRDKAMMADWGANIRWGAVAADDADYQVIRDLLGGMTIPAEGNY